MSCHCYSASHPRCMEHNIQYNSPQIYRLCDSGVQGVHEILPEAEKFRSNTSLTRDIWSPLRETSPNRLFDPNHVGEVRFTHVHGFGTGAKVAYDQRKSPFSCKRPSKELHPGPPLTANSAQSMATQSKPTLEIQCLSCSHIVAYRVEDNEFPPSIWAALVRALAMSSQHAAHFWLQRHHQSPKGVE